MRASILAKPGAEILCFLRDCVCLQTTTTESANQQSDVQAEELYCFGMHFQDHQTSRLSNDRGRRKRTAHCLRQLQSFATNVHIQPSPSRAGPRYKWKPGGQQSRSKQNYSFKMQGHKTFDQPNTHPQAVCLQKFVPKSLVWKPVCWHLCSETDRPPNQRKRHYSVLILPVSGSLCPANRPDKTRATTACGDQQVARFGDRGNQSTTAQVQWEAGCIFPI